MRAASAAVRRSTGRRNTNSARPPHASDVLYVRSLAAPFTVNTMPEETLKAMADHGTLDGILTADGGDSEEVLARFAKAGLSGVSQT